jgi:hypothetical protein
MSTFAAEDATHENVEGTATATTTRSRMKHHPIIDDDNDETTAPPITNTYKSAIQSLEIETILSEEADEADSLLKETLRVQEEQGHHTHPRHERISISSNKLIAYQPIQNTKCHILFPYLFYKTGGFGMVGPHWFGPLCILAIISVATYLFTNMGWQTCGPTTAAMCIMFALLTTYHLIQTSLRDPGLVVLNRPQPPPEEEEDEEIQQQQQQDETTAGDASNKSNDPPNSSIPRPPPRRHRQRLRWCWCEICQAHQPPDAAHCPDCNVCIRGFDHHCVWMGVCVGRGNFKQFLRFNLTWMCYLLYSIVWVSILGPIVSNNKSPEKHVTGDN